MKFDKNWLEKRWVAYTLATCSAVVLYLLLSHVYMLFTILGKLYNFISPVFIGLIIAYIINPVVMFFKNKVFKKIKARKLANNLSVFITAVLVIFIFVIMMVKLIPQLVKSVITLAGNLGGYAKSLQFFLEKLNMAAAEKNIDISGITDLGDKLIAAVTSAIPANINGIINTSFNIGKGVIFAVIAFILAIYFLLDKERLLIGFKSLMHALLSERSYNDSGDFWGRCNSILIRYIGCDILDGLIVGVANFIFMLVTGMPYNLLLSVVVGVTNLAPTFGPILGGVIGAFVLVLVNPWYALWFIIFTIILQTMDGYVIKPKLFGDSLGVSAVWILVSIIVGGRMFGVWGIMLAIPFAAIFDYVYRDMILKRLNKKNIKPEEPQEKSFLKAKTTAAKNNEKKDGVKK
jgi:predicted PurR-regulated permease PerM